MENNTNGLCPSCTNSRFCDTWAEYKCLHHKRRIYEYKTMTECEFYKKRDKSFKDSKCQCEDCLRNEELSYKEEE